MIPKLAQLCRQVSLCFNMFSRVIMKLRIVVLYLLDIFTFGKHKIMINEQTSTCFSEDSAEDVLEWLQEWKRNTSWCERDIPKVLKSKWTRWKLCYVLSRLFQFEDFSSSKRQSYLGSLLKFKSCVVNFQPYTRDYM